MKIEPRYKVGDIVLIKYNENCKINALVMEVKIPEDNSKYTLPFYKIQEAYNDGTYNTVTCFEPCISERVSGVEENNRFYEKLQNNVVELTKRNPDIAFSIVFNHKGTYNIKTSIIGEAE